MNSTETWQVKLLYGTFIISCVLLILKAHITYILLLISRIFVKGANPPAAEDLKLAKYFKNEENASLREEYKGSEI
jgi:hypothetical protein